MRRPQRLLHPLGQHVELPGAALLLQVDGLHAHVLVLLRVVGGEHGQRAQVEAHAPRALGHDQLERHLGGDARQRAVALHQQRLRPQAALAAGRRAPAPLVQADGAPAAQVAQRELVAAVVLFKSTKSSGSGLFGMFFFLFDHFLFFF